MAPPRKKACRLCTRTKARCGLERPACSRCRSRSVQCEYDYAAPAARAKQGSPSPHPKSGTLELWAAASQENDELSIGTANTMVETTTPFQSSAGVRIRDFGGQPVHKFCWSGRNSDETDGYDGLNFNHVYLSCTIDANRVRNRWLSSFLPTASQRPKNILPGTLYFLASIFQTYPSILLQTGSLHPIIHASQLVKGKMPTPLANCLALTRMWEGQEPGGEAIVHDTVAREMRKLFDERQSYDQVNLVAAFQAYLLYTMMAFFLPSPHAESLAVGEVTINLQEFACDIARTGLVCPGEMTSSRPDWESWILAASKRRTLYAMYMFENVMDASRGLPHFLGDELEGLFAPESRALWRTSLREIWEREYNLHLVEWTGGGLRIEELWFHTENGSGFRKERIAKWLREVDEFGMMLFAVTSVTHHNG